MTARKIIQIERASVDHLNNKKKQKIEGPKKNDIA